MRDSADSDDYGVTRRGKKRGQFYDDEQTFAKRDRHVQRLASEEAAADRTDDLAEDERWSTWDQSQILISNEVGLAARSWTSSRPSRSAPLRRRHS